MIFAYLNSFMLLQATFGGWVIECELLDGHNCQCMCVHNGNLCCKHLLFRHWNLPRLLATRLLPLLFCWKHQFPILTHTQEWVKQRSIETNEQNFKRYWANKCNACSCWMSHISMRCRNSIESATTSSSSSSAYYLWIAFFAPLFLLLLLLHYQIIYYIRHQ